jgi:hypothetical protein
VAWKLKKAGRPARRRADASGGAGDWEMGRTQTVWYPTHRLFRQRRPDAWAPVEAEVREALEALVQNRRDDA